MAESINMVDSHWAKSPCVLLVDDEPDILELLELTLLKMGMEVARAGNVREALTKLSERHYDLCLTDMRMPDGDGLQVVQHIAQHNLDVPVAVITAHGNMENAITALKAGAFDYLAKPVSLDQLRALVKSALNLPTDLSSPNKVLLGDSPAMQKVRDLIGREARSQAPVFISGESGSGKEMVARLIHRLGARAEHPPDDDANQQHDGDEDEMARPHAGHQRTRSPESSGRRVVSARRCRSCASSRSTAAILRRMNQRYTNAAAQKNA